MSPTDTDRMEVLSSYVPQTVLRHVASGPAEPDGPHEQRSPAALLLIDITGFTALTTASARRGKAGTEQLSRSLNTYLGRIIDLVAEHGGDVTKVLGDAVLPVWTAGDEDLATVTRRAALCGMRIAAELGELEVESGQRLSLKVGLCAGEVAATHVGGEGGRWHFLLRGGAVAQLSALEAQMGTGDLIASPEAWALLETRFVGQAVARGHVRIRTTSQSIEPQALQPVLIPVERGDRVRGYIPETCLARLDAGQADWLGELRRTTVVFISIRERLEGSALALDLLHDITLATQRVLSRFDGWLKEITMDEKGTTIVAAFGVPPFAHVDDASRAIDAAMRIQTEIRGLGLTSGVGVATGPAFGGPVGNGRRRDFAVLGQHVNVAARLTVAADDDGILCDVATHDDAPDRHRFERLAAYVLKGMATPTDVYRVRALEAQAAERPSIIGRTAELAAAAVKLDELGEGRGSIIVLEGEPGIGKSRLVEEINVRARERGFRAVVGVADEIEASTPYHAWRPVFEGLLGLTGTADRSARSTTLMERLTASGVDERLGPLLASILSLDLPDNEVTTQLTGAVRGDNTRDLLVALLRYAASSGPLVVALEDAHWLDSASWSLLAVARREIPALLVLVTRRPVNAAADPIENLGDEVLTLRLAGLSHDDAVALACERTGALRIADAVAAIVQERAEGNPLFIEQLTYALRDSGRIVVENGLVRATAQGPGLSSSIIPDTVQRVIVSRLDQLPPAEAMTLKVASVIGQRFPLRTLSGIYPFPIEPSDLNGHLETLARLDLIAPVPGLPDATYVFRHVIAQEVAYELMLSAQARQLHHALATWTEDNFAVDLAPFHGFLAHHWRRAGEPSRAIDHLELAGAQTLRTFANEEAIESLEQALALAHDASIPIEAQRAARWRLQLGEAFVNMSGYLEGRAHLETGLRLMGRAAPESAVGQGLAVVGQLVRQGLRRAGLSRQVRALSVSDRDELVAVCRAYERLAEASFYSHETLLPLYCSVRILNDAERSGSPPEIARGFAGTGALFGVIPLPRIAEWYLRRAGDHLATVDDLTTHEIVEIVIGFYATGAARWSEARERFLSVRGTARRLGDQRRLDDAIANLMEAEYLRGSFSAGLEHARELTTSARARRDPRFEVDGLIGSAYCAWQMGRADDAIGALTPLRAIVADKSDMTGETALAYHGMAAMVHLDRGEHRLALAAADEAMHRTARARPVFFGTFLGYVGPAEVYLDLWEAAKPLRDVERSAADAQARLRRFASVFPVGRPRATTLDGRLRWLRGDRSGAIRQWRAAAASAADLDMPFEEGRAWFELGRHLDAGDPARAAALGAARAAFVRADAGRLLLELDRVTDGTAQVSRVGG